jgi:receptor protein-tyrosine kinase/non-specific protein-tyrosine kinase
MSKLEEALEKAKKLREMNQGKSEEIFTPDKHVNTKNIKSLKVNNPHIVSLTQPDSPITEEYKKLKSMLIRETKANFLNTMMITSAINSEGKTLTAINLAINIAQEIDHSILLIDADLRNPMIHKYLEIQHPYGLTDYLTSDIDISEIMVRTDIGKLVVIPAGKRSNNPVEILSSYKMKHLINDLKHRYVDRYIIIDTPPLLPFAETITIGSYVDGVIFVVKEGHAQMKAIDEALGLIKNLKILGVVFNDVSSENLDKHYYSRYQRYYSTEKEAHKNESSG